MEEWSGLGRGPGYARLQKTRHKRESKNEIQGQSKRIKELVDPNGLACGMRVFHQKFGYGVIISIDGNKLDIVFEKAGTKKVIDKFVSLA